MSKGGEKMARLCPLFSGSSGNSYYLESAGSGVLIDCGRSAKQLEGVLRDNNISVDRIRAIFITHEHTDHVSALRVFSTRYKIPVYASGGTVAALKQNSVINDKVDIHTITPDGIELENMSVRTFRISHDCAEGCGYYFETQDGRRTAFATDTGIIIPEIKSALTGCDTVVLESNHDVGMLTNGGYPYPLKLRILSELGHLSNETCAKAGAEFIKSGSTRIVLAHLSQRNNIPILAEQASVCTFTENKMKRDIDYKLYVADVKGSRPIIY